MAVTTMQCEQESLITDFIRKYGTEPFTVDNCFLHQIVQSNDGRKLIVNESFILSKYKDELAKYKRKMELTDQLYRRYRFNPKLFSYEIYGTTELWFMVLHANELYTANQFDLRVVYYYDPTFFDAITRALDLETQFTAINEAEVENSLKSETISTDE